MENIPQVGGSPNGNGKISLSSLGELGVEHGGVHGKSNSSKNEKGKSQLLSSTSVSTAVGRRGCSSDNNFSFLIVSSRF